MTRQLTITAAEWASVQDGTLWLVREAPICDDRRHYILRPSAHNPLGTRRHDVHDDVRCANPCSNASDGARRLVHQVPIEFVQASAQCENLTHKLDHRTGLPIARNPSELGPGMHVNSCSFVPCPDCRIELVGPCPDCGGDGWTAEHDSSCDGYERCYALGCPVQVQCASCQFTGIATLGHAYAVGQPLPIVGEHDEYLPNPRVEVTDQGMVILFVGPIATTITDRLAHYDLASLPGKWALRLEVVPS